MQLTCIRKVGVALCFGFLLFPFLARAYDLGNSTCEVKSKLCDGVRDCDRCDDERGCKNTPFFHCRDRSGCVHFPNAENNVTCSYDYPCHYFCDGIPDCDDGSDEVTCGFGFKCLLKRQLMTVDTHQCVLPQEFLTRWNRTSNLPDFTVCAEDADRCYNHTDSGPILDTSKCWPCMDGSLIQRKQVCDGEINCLDSSDENLCYDGNAESFSECILSNKGSDCQSCKPNDGANRDKKARKPCQSNKGNATYCDGNAECRCAEDECNNRCFDNKLGICSNITNSCDILVQGCSSNMDARNLCNGICNCGGCEDENPELCSRRVKCYPDKRRSDTYDIRFKCDFESNCPNAGDEMNCPDHFYCDQNETFIKPHQVGDQKFDCKDFTDECTQTAISSLTHLIGWTELVVVLWVMCFFALLGNAAVIANTVYELVSKLHSFGHVHNRILLGHKILVLNLATADILMGFYLLLVGVYHFKFGDTYCKEKLAWLGGSTCAALGVLANVSSQCSVLIMTTMTLYRLYGITSPFSARTIRCRYIAATVILLWMISIFVAVLPLWLPNMVTGYRLDQPYTKRSTISHQQLHSLVQRARSLINYTSSSSGITTPEDFCALFPETCESQVVTVIGYYGSEGVCLPRFYGKMVEPTAAYTLVLVIFDSVVIAFMVIAYLIISCETSSAAKPVLGTPKSGGGESGCADLRTKENDEMWRRIVRLIACNVVCWLPICLASFISFAGVSIPRAIYTFTATILIPVNSAVNPWMYSNFLGSWVKRRVCRISNHTTEGKPKKNVNKPETLDGTIELVAMRNNSLDAAFSPRYFDLVNVHPEQQVSVSKM